MPLCYTDWSTGLHGVGYSEQGRLFESLTKASIENQFSDWEVYHTGWSASNPVKLSELVVEVANQLGEEHRKILDPGRTLTERTKDSTYYVTALFLISELVFRYILCNVQAENIGS